MGPERELNGTVRFLESHLMRYVTIWILAMLLTSIGLAATPTDRPSGGESLLPPESLSALSLTGDQAALVSVQTVPVQNQSFDQALKLTTSTGIAAAWNAQLVAPISRPIKSGDVLLGHFWLRCVRSMTDEGYTDFVVEQATAPFDKAIDFPISATQDWREVFVSFRAMRDYPAGSAHICLRLGYDSQTIEIGGVELIDYGASRKLDDLPRTKITYEGRSADAPWRKAALARIEQIRKGDWNIHLVDSAGKPISGADIHAVLVDNAFGFGACVDVQHLLAEGPDGDKYRDVVAKLFNQVVFENDMKWQALYNGISPQLDKAVQWLLDHHIRIRGHNLVWPSWRWLPAELQQYKNDPEKLRQITAEHITQVVSHFKGKCFQWDVVNEPYSNHDLTDILGRDAINQWYWLARKADPSCKLYMNDFGILGTDTAHENAFFDILKAMRDLGGPIDGIGIQSHFGEVLPAPEHILKTFDRFSKLGLPIESTELSLNLDDQQLQADYMRDYLIACYSHPDVKGVMLWGFWETAAKYWRPKAAMYTTDWSLKPEGKVWIDLVHHQWTTNVHERTNPAGQTRIRGFFGDYEITVTQNGQSHSFRQTFNNTGQTTMLTIQ